VAKVLRIHPSELPVELKEILIGLLLGNLHCQRRSPTGNTRLLFEQGEIHKEYLLHTFDLSKAIAVPRLDSLDV